MNAHFVCTGGCGGVAPQEGTCMAETCLKHGQPLLACACEDNQHTEVMNADKASE